MRGHAYADHGRIVATVRWDIRSQLVAGTIIVSVLIVALPLGGQVVGGLAGLGGLMVAWIAAWVGWRAAGRDLPALKARDLEGKPLPHRLQRRLDRWTARHPTDRPTD